MSMVEDVHHSGGAKKYIAAVLFGIIILVFIFLGTNTRQPNMGPGYAARVNDQIISVREYRTSLEQMVQFYAQMFGGEFDAEAQKRMRVKSAALEQLISRSAMIQAADRSGFSVTAEEVRDIITSIPAFQQEGKFRREFYDNFLANRRLSAAQFEEDLKRDILFGKVREIFQNGVVPSPFELEKLEKLSQNKYNLEFLKLDASSLDKVSKASAEEIKQFLTNAENMKSVEDSFNANKKSFEKEEQVHARHILVTIDPSKSGSESEALLKIKKAQDLLKTKSFEVVAKEYSDDPGSKAKGGDLGFFSHGRMVKEFEDAAFSQPVGKVGEIVKTKYGYHIIKVEARNAKVEANLDIAKNEIAQNMLARQKRDKIIAQFKEAASKGSLSDVNKLASQSGLKWEETGSFSLTDGAVPKLGDSEEVYTAISQTSADAPLYKNLVMGAGEPYVVRFKSKTSVEQKTPVVKAREELKQKIASARVRDAFSKWNEAIVKSSKIERNNAILEGEADGGSATEPE